MTPIKTKEGDKKIKIAKVHVTSVFNQWWISDMSDIIDIPPSQIISAIEYNGGMYLVFWYEEE